MKKRKKKKVKPHVRNSLAGPWDQTHAEWNNEVNSSFCGLWRKTRGDDGVSLQLRAAPVYMCTHDSAAAATVHWTVVVSVQ